MSQFHDFSRRSFKPPEGTRAERHSNPRAIFNDIVNFNEVTQRRRQLACN